MALHICWQRSLSYPMSLQNKIRQFGRVASDVRLLPFYAQRRLLSTSVRDLMADRIARRLGGRGQAVGNALAHEGIVRLGKLLTNDHCAELRAYFESKLVSDGWRAPAKFFQPLSPTRDPLSHIGSHSETDIVTAPHLVALANRPDILAQVEEFLGCKPTISYLSAWWSYPTSLGAQHEQNFHRDVDDWRFVKLFVHLTDVGLDNGPHAYVLNSVRSESFRRIGRFSDKEIALAFDNQIISVTGEAGQAFLENTFGLHRGTPVQSGIRLIFQVIYGLRAGPYGPRQPVAANETGLDPYVNRVYLRST